MRTVNQAADSSTDRVSGPVPADNSVRRYEGSGRTQSQEKVPIEGEPHGGREPPDVRERRMATQESGNRCL